jgi:hypothetical protein
MEGKWRRRIEDEKATQTQRDSRWMAHIVRLAAADYLCF